MRSALPIILIQLVILAGCTSYVNHSDPITPTTTEKSTHGIWGAWKFDFDETSGSIQAIPVRSSLAHLNVTPFLFPPACSNCLELEILEFSTSSGILNLRASLTNPTSHPGRDIRAILLWDTGHIWLNNPDDYTLLFDDGPPKTLNPFIAFAVEEPTREFKPDSIYSRDIEFRFNESGHFGEITFVIDASYPGNCREPYEISNQTISDHLVGDNPETVNCVVSDWQTDVTGVTLYPGPLADNPVALFPNPDNHWSGTLINENNALPGQYELLIQAMSPGGNLTDSIYDYIVVTVDQAPPSIGLDSGPWPMIGHDASHTSRSNIQGPVVTPVKAWDSANSGVTWSSGYTAPAVSFEGNIYAARVDGLYCLTSEGQLAWKTPPPFSDVRVPPMPLLCGNGLVIVCWSSILTNSAPQGIYAYDMNTGTEEWSKINVTILGSTGPKGFSVYDSPVLNQDDLLVAVAREHIVVALDVDNGTQKWVWPNNVSEYHSIPAGSYTDGWRGSPALTSDGKVVLVADWFEAPKLVILYKTGGLFTEKAVKTMTAVNCHPLVTSNDMIVLAGFNYDIITTEAVVEAYSSTGFFQWEYIDDRIQVLQGVAGIASDNTLYFLDGLGVNDMAEPFNYTVYMLALNPNGSKKWRKALFTRTFAPSPVLSHFRDGVAVGSDGTIYASGSWNHLTSSQANVTGVWALDPAGNILWQYGAEINKPGTDAWYGPPVFDSSGRLLANRFASLQALL